MLSIILTPKIGSVERTNGRIAQCMAQASEVVIPIVSQLIR